MCLISVDGADFAMLEPIPFDPKWHLHKLNGLGLRCEIGMHMQTGWIVWVNGPFPCGEWSDLAISRFSLAHLSQPWERCIADGGVVIAPAQLQLPVGATLLRTDKGLQSGRGMRPQISA